MRTGRITPHLFKVDGLSAVVGACDDVDAAYGAFAVRVVGHEDIHRRLHQRMAAVGDVQLRVVV